MPVIKIVKNKKQLQIPCVETTLDESRPVIQDLMDTAHYHKTNCAGLAANQIGSTQRVFVVKIRGKFRAFINPSFTPGGRKAASIEGCLSFPGKQTQTTRWTIITTSAPKGKRKGLVLSGIEAVAYQHELDHLNGITLTSRKGGGKI